MSSSATTYKTWPVKEELHDNMCTHHDNETKAGMLDTGTTIVNVFATTQLVK